MKFIRTAILLIFILPLFSCAVNGPLFVHEPVLADADPCLYIYRPESLYLKDSKWEFLIDKEKHVLLENGTYAKIQLTPGTHEIISGKLQGINQLPIMIMVDTVKGRNVYVKYEIKFAGSPLMNIIDRPKFNNRLHEMDETRALKDLKNLHLCTEPVTQTKPGFEI
jgi:hypothetical protein